VNLSESESDEIANLLVGCTALLLREGPDAFTSTRGPCDDVI
jgi:hypothetical protein